jgi:hypothetical protein
VWSAKLLILCQLLKEPNDLPLLRIVVTGGGHSYVYSCVNTSSNSWDSEAKQGLSGLVKQIEQRFNKELEKNADGSPKLFKS